MGGSQDPKYISELAKFIKENYKDLKVCWYTGDKDLSSDINLTYFDYYKLGPYDEKYGSIDNPKTNQRLYKVNRVIEEDGKDNISLEDITSKFWRSEVS